MIIKNIGKKKKNMMTAKSTFGAALTLRSERKKTRNQKVTFRERERGRERKKKTVEL